MGKIYRSYQTTPFSVTLDYRLNWHTQLRLVKIKALKSLDTVKMLRNKWFGLSPQRLLSIYRMLLRSIFDYDSMASQNFSTMSIMKVAIRAYPTTPIPPMQTLCGETLLIIRRVFPTLKYCVKIANIDDHINYGVFYTSQHIISNIFVQQCLHKLELNLLLKLF